MGQFSDVKWPSEYIELTRIEELLHCKICYEYIETSVITPCSHNYCSLCIRKFLHYKTQCPICFETIYEKDLHANRILDEFTQSYLSLREKLLSCIKGARVEHTSSSLVCFEPIKTNTPEKTSRSFVTTPTTRLFKDNSNPSSNNLTRKESPLDNTPSNKSTLDLNSSRFTPKEKIQGIISPGNTGRDTLKINSIFAVKSEERVVRSENFKKKVPCPVCSIEISESNINRHLDDCLKRQKSMSSFKTIKNNLEPMPKYVLNLMKDSELRKLLKKYGLSTTGVRKTMEKRLQKFSALYNAERDKLVPKSIEELVKLCEGEENAERNIFKQNSSDLMPGIDRKTDLGLIEKTHKEYLARNKDDYQKLIETINSRETSRPRTKRSLFRFETGEESNCVASTSSASLITTSESFLNQSDDTNETNSFTADVNRWFPHDSDSTNASYPLQHYSNEDPMQWLALEMTLNSQDSNLKLETPCSSKNDAPLSCRIKTETPEQATNVSDVLNSSNQELSSLGDGETNYLGEMNESNRDIFDASTEDNLSDSSRRILGKKKSKKFIMKRFKVEEDCQSTDSDSNIITSPRFTPRKTTKINKNRDKKVERENGKENAKEKSVLDFQFEVSTALKKPGKENSTVESRDLTITRRSSRQRNHVSYAIESKRKNKPLDEVPLNISKSDLTKQTSSVIDNTDQFENPIRRSLRKRSNH